MIKSLLMKIIQTFTAIEVPVFTLMLLNLFGVENALKNFCNIQS